MKKILFSMCWVALAAVLTVSAKQASAEDEAKPVAAYPLATCPVSGGKLGSMGDPIVKAYEGRQVKFCCGGCVGAFEKDPAKYVEQIDAQIIKDQTKLYPLDTCLVSGEAMGEGDGIAFVVGNRMVKVCCGGCEKKVKADPKAFVAKLDAAAIKAQSEDYPMDTCAISGAELSAGAKNVVVAGRLVKVCCGNCAKKVQADPLATIQKVDEARKAG